MSRIMVAEDNAANRELIREVLELAGHEVIVAEDGGEALKALPSARPDLLLLDIQMPVLDGFQLMMRLRADPQWKDLPIVALTAFAMQGDRDRALSSGFDDYVTKPIDFKDLLTRVAAHTSEARESRP